MNYYIILRYILIVVVLFLLFRFIPTNTLSYLTILLLLFVIIILLILIELLWSYVISKTDLGISKDPCVCPVTIEKFDNTSHNNNTTCDLTLKKTKDDIVREVIKKLNRESLKAQDKLEKEDENDFLRFSRKYALREELTHPYALFNDAIKETEEERIKRMRLESGVDALFEDNYYSKYGNKWHTRDEDHTERQKNTKMIIDEMKYDVTPKDTFDPRVDRQQDRSYEYGYSFIPPKHWYPPCKECPVCITDKKCPVCPVTTSGWPVDVKEWDNSRRVSPPDQINIDYVRDKLNAGK